MTSAGRQLHLGVSLDGAGHHPAAWREADALPERLFTAGYLVGMVREAERSALDFVTLDDSFALQATTSDRVRGHFDALLALARVAPLTRSIGLIPTVTTTHTEPFHISKNVATLDFVSLGRAGWRVAVSATEDEARHFGRRPVPPVSDLFDEASDTIDVVGRLWDSWEHDAVIRDRPTGRYIDRDKLHYVDFQGRFFSVRGPSITPRPPQGQPPVAIDATSEEAVSVAASRADLVFIDVDDIDSARAARAHIRDRAGAAGRDGETVLVLANISVLLAADDSQARDDRERLDAVAGGPPPSVGLDVAGTSAGLAALMEKWLRAGAVDGFVVRPAVLRRGLAQLSNEVVPALQDLGVFRRTYGGATLRDHLGLPHPANRYATSSSTGRTP